MFARKRFLRIIAGMKRINDKNLFSVSEEKKLLKNAPLPVRMRPKTIDEFAGQSHFVGPGKLLRRMLDADRLTSVIFYGPPGVGKTSLARVVANHTKSSFQYLNAPGASVNDVRSIVSQAKDRLLSSGTRTVLFLDEIHRFNRAQQDVLLDDVENGIVTLIGATTENPFFSVNSPLISRSTVFTFESLSKEDITNLLKRALSDKERGFGELNIDAHDDALEFLAVMSDGDARKGLTALEVAILSQKKVQKTDKITLNLELVKESIQRKSIKYDGTGDTHYDLASALQKSLRGSDPDAAIYWLARLIAGGEDPRFIARRVAICATEDVGNADPMATVLAASAVQIAEFVGMPEAQLALAQAVTYIASAPKSNASANAIWKAISDVRSGVTLEVPKHIRDAHYAGAKKLGHGIGYKYPHDYPGGYVPQEYLESDRKISYYEPKSIGREKLIKQYLDKIKEIKNNTQNQE